MAKNTKPSSNEAMKYAKLAPPIEYGNAAVNNNITVYKKIELRVGRIPLDKGNILKPAEP